VSILLKTILTSSLVLGLAACDSGDEVPTEPQLAKHTTARGTEVEADEEQLLVCAVNYPLQYFAERIGAELADVALPAPPGIDPATWKPNRGERTLIRGQCELMLINGAGYARWVTTAGLPDERVVDTTADIADRLIRFDADSQHRGNFASITWLDPTIAIAQARAVAQALIRARPSHAKAIKRRHVELEADLRELDARLTAVTQPLRSQLLIFSSSSYPYLARRYSLQSRSPARQTQALLDTDSWESLTQMGAPGEVKAVIWEVAPSNDVAAELGSHAVPWAVFSTAANRPERGDFLFVMNANADALETLWHDLDRSAK
jgi:zinc transport system substrate-binding protein